ncbi:polysaccharide deacetylase family protein, partial [Candidatus Woesebacteria bacterium]|nr:polysaccharide deacetylase family protein [Candidatus Woesebacteria bacterium]
LYGPCVNLPTLMYHHIQDMALAKSKSQGNLTVDTETFKNQMQYLADKGYKTLAMTDLTGFFENGSSISKKSVLLTFDDGYDDFATNAVPILRQFGFKATLFTPTGLINNPGYLSWSQVADIASGGLIEFANHTWSHKAMRADGSIDEKEISTADIQLGERGLDNPKVFAYPYGTVSGVAEAILTKYGYTLAFTTRHGSILCKKQRLTLPRIRIGNVSLSSYGF